LKALFIIKIYRFIVNGKYNIKRLLLYEHKLLALHNIILKNLIFKNNSLVQHAGPSVIKKMPNLD
jgi:hypothetical protein